MGGGNSFGRTSSPDWNNRGNLYSRTNTPREMSTMATTGHGSFPARSGRDQVRLADHNDVSYLLQKINTQDGGPSVSRRPSPSDAPLREPSDMGRDDDFGDGMHDDKHYTQKDVLFVIEQLKRSSRSHVKSHEETDDMVGNEDDAVRSIYDTFHSVDTTGQRGSILGRI